MKNFLLLLFLVLISSSLMAQDTEDSYRQYMMIYLKPNLQSLDKLKANMKTHNETYHNTKPYDARVYSIMNGPNAGWWVWQMGPCTFADLDKREQSEAHDTHWDNEILAYCDDYKYFEFWRRMDDVSNLDELDPPYAATRIRFLEVAEGQQHRTKDLFAKIKEAVAAIPGDNYWAVYDNKFLQGYKQGRHMATITPIKNFADLDKDNGFVMQYEKLNGKNSFQSMLKNWNDIFTDTYDEFITLMPALSGIKN